MGSGFIFSQQAIVSCGDKINPDPFHYPKFQPQRKLIVTAYDSFFTIQCHKRTGFQNLCCIFCPDQYRKIKAQSSNRPMAIRTIIFNDQTGCQTDLFHHLIGSISGNNSWKSNQGRRNYANRRNFTPRKALIFCLAILSFLV